jgi:hypothetical protein
MKRLAVYSIFTVIVGVSMIGSSCSCVKKEGVVTTPPASGQVCFNVRPPGAEVYVDGRPAGRAGDFTRARGCMALDAGPHKISVRMRGYASYDTTVVAGSSPKYVNVTLTALGAPPPHRPPQPPGPVEGMICFNVQPASADVYIDGRLVGRANQFTSARGCLALSHGPHKVTVSKKNFTTHQQTIVVGSQPRYVTAKLKNVRKPAPKPPKPAPRPRPAPPPPAPPKHPVKPAPGAPAPKPAPAPGPLPAPAKPPKAAKGKVCFSVQPADADVYVDDRRMGRANDFSAAKGCMLLDKGPHTITVHKKNFTRHDQKIIVGDGVLNVNVKLKSEKKK